MIVRMRLQLLLAALVLGFVIGGLEATPASATATAAGALWFGSNYDHVNNKFGDYVAEIPPSQLAKSGRAIPVIINELGLTDSMGVAFNQGNLWVTTLDNHVFEFTSQQLANLSKNPTPTPAVTITSSSTFKFILACAFDAGGNLWIVDAAADGVHELTKAQLAAGSGDLTPTVTLTSTSLASPAFATFDSSGNLWVSSEANSQIVEFALSQLSSSGSVTPTVIISSPDHANLSGPGAVQFDNAGNLWVANSFNSTVTEFTQSQLVSSGSPAAAVILSSTAVNGGNSIQVPWGLAFDGGNNLWVFNYTSGTISKFTNNQLQATGAPVPSVFLTGLALYAGELTFGPPSM
jgi:sugar lactone lactonase YvrE